MNCSMALEDSELDRNKVFGSAWRAGTEEKKMQWLERASIQNIQQWHITHRNSSTTQCQGRNWISAAVTSQEKNAAGLTPSHSPCRVFQLPPTVLTPEHSANWELCGRGRRCECECGRLFVCPGWTLPLHPQTTGMDSGAPAALTAGGHTFLWYWQEVHSTGTFFSWEKKKPDSSYKCN